MTERDNEHKSEKKRSVPLTEDAEKELDRYSDLIKTLTVVEAKLQALQVGRTQIGLDDVHRAESGIRVMRHSRTLTWTLRLSMTIFVSLAINQIAFLFSPQFTSAPFSTQVSLLLLPIIALVWTFVIAYTFRDLL